MTQSILYASVDASAIVYLPTGAGFGPDVTLVGLGGRGEVEAPRAAAPDGVYRRVNGDFLAWMSGRVEAALKRTEGVDLEKLSAAIDFFHLVRDAAEANGVRPAARPPVGYAKPVRFEFRWEGWGEMWPV